MVEGSGSVVVVIPSPDRQGVAIQFRGRTFARINTSANPNPLDDAVRPGKEVAGHTAEWTAHEDNAAVGRKRSRHLGDTWVVDSRDRS